MSDTTDDDDFVVYDFDPNNLPADFLRAIGLAVAASSQTESIMQQFIGGLLGVDHVITISLTTHMSHPLKDKIIRTLSEIRAPNIEELDEIDELLDAVDSALKKRNTIVHNALARHPKTNVVFSLREKASGSLQVELQPITVHEIEEHATAIYKIGMDVYRFMAGRNLIPANRTAPLRAPIKRGPKARQERRSGSV